MNPPKAVWAAIIFTLVIGSSALLISQMDNLFGKAQSGKITGTIVLQDGLQFESYVGAEELRFLGSGLIAPVALPGSACFMTFTVCSAGCKGNTTSEYCNAIGTLSEFTVTWHDALGPPPTPETLTSVESISNSNRERCQVFRKNVITGSRAYFIKAVNTGNLRLPIRYASIAYVCDA